jgi:plasmid stabilization system protein ParE
MKPTLQERLVRYLAKNPTVEFPKATLCDLAREKMGVTGESVGRRLRVLVEVSDWPHSLTDTPEHTRARELLQGGKVRRKLVNGNAVYWYEPPASKTVRRVVIEGGVAKEIIETVSAERV